MGSGKLHFYEIFMLPFSFTSSLRHALAFFWACLFRVCSNDKMIYRCSLEAPGLIHNFVGTNGARNGWGFGSEYRGFMTRCEIRTGSLSRCGQFLLRELHAWTNRANMQLILQDNRNQIRCLSIWQGWFLRWWGVVMPPFLCTEDSAKLLAMGVLCSGARWDRISCLIV